MERGRRRRSKIHFTTHCDLISHESCEKKEPLIQFTVFSGCFRSTQSRNVGIDFGASERR